MVISVRTARAVVAAAAAAALTRNWKKEQGWMLFWIFFFSLTVLHTLGT